MIEKDKEEVAKVLARCIMSIPKEKAIKLLSAKIIPIQSKQAS